MKKLILLVAVAAGVAYVVKFKSDQVKAAATRVTHDPRVQSALATASDKAGPVASSVSASVSSGVSSAASAASAAGAAVSERLHRPDDLEAPAVPEEAVEVAEGDPVSAPEFAGDDVAKEDAATQPENVEPASADPSDRQPDPLTDPLETLDGEEGAGGSAQKPTE